MNGDFDSFRRGRNAVLGVVVGTVLAIWFFSGQKRDFAAIKASASPPFAEVTSDDLLREYDDVPAADSRYKNKVVRITGPVTEPQSSKVVTACVVLSGKGGFLPVAVNCFLADGEGEKQKQIATGQTVTLVGVVEGKIARGISVQAATIELSGK